MVSTRRFVTTRNRRLLDGSGQAPPPLAEELPVETSDAQPAPLEYSAERTPTTVKETWRLVDASAREFCASVDKIWKDPNGPTFAVLRQKGMFKGLWRCFFASVLVALLTWGACKMVDTLLLGGQGQKMTLMGIELALALALTIGGLLFWAWYRDDSVAPKTDHKMSILQNEINGRFVARLIESGPREINLHKSHLKIESNDGRTSTRNCVNELVLAWRKMQLIPYIIEPEWQFFKWVEVRRHSKKNRAPRHYGFVGLVASAYLSLAAFVQFSAMGAALTPGPFIAGAISMAFFASAWRRYITGRMNKFLDLIEYEITYYSGDGQAKPETWEEVIADYDPTPDLADALQDSYDFIADANRRGARRLD